MELWVSCSGFVAQIGSKKQECVGGTQKDRTQSRNTHCSARLRVFTSSCVYNNPGDFISHISSRRVRCPCVDGRIWLTGRREDLPRRSSKYSRRGPPVTQRPTRRASRRVSRTLHCCVTLKARWPGAGGCLLCQSSKARLAIFVPLQGQFAVCDLSKGNVTWQELLTSEEHLGLSEDIGHSYSFRVYPFVIFKIGFPPPLFYVL